MNKPLSQMSLVELVKEEADLYDLYCKLRNDSDSVADMDMDVRNYAIRNIGHVHDYLHHVRRHIRKRLGTKETT